MSAFNPLPQLTDDQNEYLEKLCALTGVYNIQTRITNTVGTSDVMFVLPTTTEQNAFVDDDGGINFPEWYDLHISVLTDKLMDRDNYFVLGYRHSNLTRQFAGNKIAISWDVEFDEPWEVKP